MSYIEYKEPTLEQYKEMTSETGKYRHLTAKHCSGAGVDIASQGSVVVPWAFSFDLPREEFDYYNSNNPPKGPIHLRGHATKLPFENDSLDFVYSSHLLEDYEDWIQPLREWTRVLKPGGNLIILVPDKKLWNEAIEKGQPPNCSHKHESYAGELSTYATMMGWTVVHDELTNCFPGDYSVLFVAKRK
jgi:SAM-dependent methyltransferase